MSTDLRLPSFTDLPEPIREEIWGAERLEQHALDLAALHQVRPGRRGDRRLSPRVLENGQVLLDAYRSIAAAIRDERDITPAAEWLVDNFHLVDEQLREIREDLPPGFYRELPKLASGPFRGYPRVYALAHDFVAHTDSLFDAEMLARFVRAYQSREPLTIGELWAIAISLRVVLVENLRRLAERMVRARAVRDQAEALADRLLDADRPADQEALLRRYEEGTRDVPFVVVLLGRLRDQDPQVTPALDWLHRRLEEQRTTAEEVVAVEYRRQTSMNATVRNVITSMRLISTFDWAGFFESVSRVEAALAEHPGYREMDFGTRDQYRHAVEELARDAKLPEVLVAHRAVRRAAEEPVGERPADPGDFLIGGARAAFEREIGARLPPGRAFERAFHAWATPGYLGTIVLVTLLLLAVPVGFE
ncbi:MAG TPA: glycosyl transferase, partial [Thermoanaerobaculia bacterium]|nr:glycosyl transferase [Thermoanaerobaculia bacterium]